MRIEQNKDDTAKVWMTYPEDLRKIESVINQQDDINPKRVVVELMANVGLRVDRVVWVSHADVKRTSDGQDYLLKVRGAKDTTGDYNDGKSRDVYIPDSVERLIFERQVRNELEENEAVIDVTPRTVQNWVSEIGEKMAERHNDDDWTYLSCHDFRRSYANHLIHDTDIQASVIMNQLGWEDWSTLKNYTDNPSEKVIQNEFAELN